MPWFQSTRASLFKSPVSICIIEIEDLYLRNKFDEIIALLSDDVLETETEKDNAIAAELYIWRGITWYDKKE